MLVGMLSGTNCYAIGVGQKRFLIDACLKDYEPFLDNLERFMKEQNCYFEKVFITHSHFDHMAGAYSVVELHKKLNKPLPQIMKFVNNSAQEQERLKDTPEMKEFIHHTKEGDKFTLTETLTNGENMVLDLMPIETPGHLSDHLCFLLKTTKAMNRFVKEKYSIFTGDHIVGARSTWFEDYPLYF